MTRYPHFHVINHHHLLWARRKGNMPGLPAHPVLGKGVVLEGLAARDSPRGSGLTSLSFTASDGGT